MVMTASGTSLLKAERAFADVLAVAVTTEHHYQGNANFASADYPVNAGKQHLIRNLTKTSGVSIFPGESHQVTIDHG